MSLHCQWIGACQERAQELNFCLSSKHKLLLYAQLGLFLYQVQLTRDTVENTFFLCHQAYQEQIFQHLINLGKAHTQVSSLLRQLLVQKGKKVEINV